jgi:hypothetical protein
MRGVCHEWRAEVEEGGHDALLSGGARAHLSACRECRAARGAAEELRRLVAELEPVSAPADFEFRLRARMAGRRGADGPRRFRSRASFGLTAAAVSVLMLSAVLLTRDRTPNPAPAAGLSRDGAALPAFGPSPAGVASGSQSRVGERASLGEVARGGDAGRIRSRRPQARPAGSVKPTTAGLTAGRDEATFAVRQAPVRTANISEGGAASGTARPLPILVGGGGGPLRLLLRDEHGDTHVLQTRSVSFGAQHIVARGRDAKGAAAKVDEGVW